MNETTQATAEAVQCLDAALCVEQTKRGTSKTNGKSWTRLSFRNNGNADERELASAFVTRFDDGKFSLNLQGSQYSAKAKAHGDNRTYHHVCPGQELLIHVSYDEIEAAMNDNQVAPKEDLPI